MTRWFNLKANTKIKNPGKMELTAVVIDEAVFDMIQGGKSYYDLYQGLNKLDSLDLKNFNLMQRLVGRQKIEKNIPNINKTIRITQNQVSIYDANCNKNEYRIYDKIYTSYNPVPLLYKEVSKYPYHYTNIKKNT